MTSSENSPALNPALTSTRSNWRAALVMALGVFVVMTGLSMWSAIVSVRGFPRHSELSHLNIVKYDAEQFRDEHGRFPADVDELRDHTGGAYYQDQWGHPLRFEFVDDELAVSTLGRDGQPGGWGFDADLTSESDLNVVGQLTPWQLVFDANPQAFVTCLMAGLIGGVLTFNEFSSRRPTARSWVSWSMSITIYAVLTYYVTTVMASLHLIPNGH